MKADRHNIRHNITISLSLVCITLLIIFVANGLGLIPDENVSRVRERISLSETIAIQFSAAIEKDRYEVIDMTAKSVVARNDQIQSVLVSKVDGSTIASHGNHPARNSQSKSTPDHIKVPIFKDNNTWGVVEISFSPLKSNSTWGFTGSAFFQLIAFITICGFFLYFFLVRKLLRYLDPSKVIPARVKAALNAVLDGIVFIDNEGRIILANKAFEDKINCQENEIVGDKLSDLEWFYPENSEDSNKPFPWYETLLDSENRNHVTLGYKSSNSEPLTLIVNTTPLKDAKGNVSGALVSFNDVTELEKMSNELESMTRFLRHEMSNALLGAAGIVNVLGHSENLSEEQKNLVSRTQQLHGVIKNLLESVKEARSIEDSFAQEATKPVRVDMIVKEVSTYYSDIYSDNKFLFESDGKELVVMCKKERVIQMLDKLATNAIDHGKPDTAIILSCNRENDHAVIKVVSEGGTLPEDKEVIFDLFASFRDKAEENENQGIGLYVVKLIAETYGGSVEARDRKDVCGAEFIIKLPVV